MSYKVTLLTLAFLLTTSQSFGENEIYNQNASALKNYHYQLAKIAADAPSKVNFFQNGTVTEGFCPSTTDSEAYIKDSSVSLEGCPALATKCQLKSYLVPGNQVIVVKQYKDFSCAWYSNKHGETSGWLPNKYLQMLPLSATQADDWLGNWYAPNSQITFSKAKEAGQLTLDGSATTQGGDEGNVNEGTLEKQTVTPNKNEIDFVGDEKICQIYFRLINHDMLLAVDNGQCGGINVSFGGVYTRVKR